MVCHCDRPIHIHHAVIAPVLNGLSGCLKMANTGCTVVYSQHRTRLMSKTPSLPSRLLQWFQGPSVCFPCFPGSTHPLQQNHSNTPIEYHIYLIYIYIVFLPCPKMVFPKSRVKFDDPSIRSLFARPLDDVVPMGSETRLGLGPWASPTDQLLLLDPAVCLMLYHHTWRLRWVEPSPFWCF